MYIRCSYICTHPTVIVIDRRHPALLVHTFPVAQGRSFPEGLDSTYGLPLVLSYSALRIHNEPFTYSAISKHDIITANHRRSDKMNFPLIWKKNAA